jgi:hypothetical protein
MPRTVLIASLVLPLLSALVAWAQPAITEIEGAKPNRSVFKDASLRAPLEIRSAEEAARHFGEDALAALKKQVDFEKQLVLIFAWRGSGQDRLTYAILDSNPEQVRFSYRPGRTRDLRPHLYLYALRTNVRWSGP